MNTKNRVAICIDVSGSTDGISRGIVDLRNATIEQIKAQKGHDALVTQIHFGHHARKFDRSDVISVKFANVPIDKVMPMSYAEHVPEGGTPLYDSIGRAIHEMEDIHDSETSYICFLISDGRENESRFYPDAQSIRKLIVEKQGTDRWTFAALIHKDYVDYFRSLNAVPDGNIKSWGGIKEAEVATVAAVGTYFTARSAGKTASKAVFTTDLSSVTKGDLRRLRDITSEVKVKAVKKGIRIDHCINEWTNGNFKPGINFYMLQKKERLQADKDQFIICEKGQKTFYLADRAFFGMPSGEIKLDPGNHANFDIWVLSTSNNRNLLAGSRVIVWSGAKAAAVHLHGIPGAVNP